jgi:hypothetical protein
MSTHAFGSRAERDSGVRFAISPHWWWLGGGFLIAFGLSYLLTDVLAINRDLFYGVYALAVIGLFAAWARATSYDLLAAVRRRWVWAVGLGVLTGALLAVMVIRTGAGTPRPDGIALLAAVGWRGIVYGAADGLLLSAFPILVVFAALVRSRVNDGRRGTFVIGAAALTASLLMTGVEHVFAAAQ